MTEKLPTTPIVEIEVKQFHTITTQGPKGTLEEVAKAAQAAMAAIGK